MTSASVAIWGKTDLLAIERAAVNGWPAFETAAIDGWLARYSSGGSVRANSLAALDYTGDDIEASIAGAIAFYRQRGAVPRITVSEVCAPAGLDGILEAAGWHRNEDHVTMARRLPDVVTTMPADVSVDSAPTPEWFSVYLEGLSANRRAIAPRLVAGVPAPRAFFSCHRDGRVVASGLSVYEGAVASVQCMATLPEARRTGAARAVLAAIEYRARSRGHEVLYLQAEGANRPALNLYERVGFTVAGHYHVRELRN